MVAAFRKSLNDAGYFEGQNMAIEYRWAEGEYDRLPCRPADLVSRQVSVMIASTRLQCSRPERQPRPFS